MGRGGGGGGNTYDRRESLELCIFVLAIGQMMSMNGPKLYDSEKGDILRSVLHLLNYIEKKRRISSL